MGGEYHDRNPAARGVVRQLLDCGPATTHASATICADAINSRSASRPDISSPTTLLAGGPSSTRPLTRSGALPTEPYSPRPSSTRRSSAPRCAAPSRRHRGGDNRSLIEPSGRDAGRRRADSRRLGPWPSGCAGKASAWEEHPRISHRGAARRASARRHGRSCPQESLEARRPTTAPRLFGRRVRSSRPCIREVYSALHRRRDA